MDPRMKAALKAATADLLAMPETEFRAALEAAHDSDFGRMLRYAHRPLDPEFTNPPIPPVEAP
jgi:hypothetical protein